MVPPDTVIPPFTVYGGKPAQFLGELTEAISTINEDLAKTYYKNFIGLGGTDGQSAAGTNQGSTQ